MRFVALRVAPLPMVALFLLLASAYFAELTGASATLTTALSSHVLNATLSGAGEGSNWPVTTIALRAIAPTVNSTVCSDLPPGVIHCEAFLIRESEITLGLQLSIVTSTALSGNSTYYLLSQWVDGKSETVSTILNRLTTACATALSTSLSSLAVTTGTYTVPCRNSETYSYLPACAEGEDSVTTVYILEPSSDLQAYFSAYLCVPNLTETCAKRIVVESPSDSLQYTVVTFKGLPKALEAVLAYVADVRAIFTGLPQNVGPSVGDPTTAVTAKAVELRHRGMHAVLFSTNESMRMYSPTTRMTIRCNAVYAYWSLAFIAVLPLCAILFRYAWFRGRQQSKKTERRRIVADEMRIIQGYTNPAAPQGAGSGPPPGFEVSAAVVSDTTSQWVTDMDHNFYNLNAAAQTDDATRQNYVDPDTGAVDHYAVDDANIAGGAAAAASQASQQTDNATNKNVIYQAQGDHETGEAYQYPAGTSEAAPEQVQAADVSIAEDAQDATAGGDYQTYIDPNTGEMYQYAEVDANVEAGEYQYVDQAAGNTYQYTNPNAAAVYEYVDPTTGETYQYTAETRESDDAAAAAQWQGAATPGNVYVDPHSGEMYQCDVPQQ
ncbi:hypothetical protein, conserved [Leishmania tarentolae]|uniref:Uncharacterized protein n=1 Tax=Leishmania tarentolae TaxID=5689 RepID=A0A640KSI2_LEITA|nr:hypothetical protein, conserved [Leishmania tarentolae]